MSRKWSLTPAADRKRIRDEEEGLKRPDKIKAREIIWKRWRRKEKPGRRLETEKGRAEIKEMKLN